MELKEFWIIVKFYEHDDVFSSVMDLVKYLDRVHSMLSTMLLETLV